MTVTVRLPKELRRLYGVPHPATVAAGTVRDVVAALDEAHPGVGHRLVDGGRLRQHIIVFVGDDQAALDDPVPPGAEVTVLTAVAGGSAGHQPTWPGGQGWAGTRHSSSGAPRPGDTVRWYGSVNPDPGSSVVRNRTSAR